MTIWKSGAARSSRRALLFGASFTSAQVREFLVALKVISIWLSRQGCEWKAVSSAHRPCTSVAIAGLHGRIFRSAGWKSKLEPTAAPSELPLRSVLRRSKSPVVSRCLARYGRGPQDRWSPSDEETCYRYRHGRTLP